MISCRRPQVPYALPMVVCMLLCPWQLLCRTSLASSSIKVVVVVVVVGGEDRSTTAFRRLSYLRFGEHTSVTVWREE